MDGKNRAVAEGRERTIRDGHAHGATRLAAHRVVRVAADDRQFRDRALVGASEFRDDAIDALALIQQALRAVARALSYNRRCRRRPALWKVARLVPAPQPFVGRRSMPSIWAAASSRRRE